MPPHSSEDRKATRRDNKLWFTKLFEVKGCQPYLFFNIKNTQGYLKWCFKYYNFGKTSLTTTTKTIKEMQKTLHNAYIITILRLDHKVLKHFMIIGFMTTRSHDMN